MTPIEGCRMNQRCAQRWETLELVPDNPRVRYCGQCESVVHLVERQEEFLELARQGKCIAMSAAQPIRA